MSFPKPVRESRTPKPLKRGRRKRSRVPEALARHRALEQQADRLWSLLVRAKSPRCVRCHVKPVTDPHHLVSRRYRALRWELDNGAPLCRACHCDVGEDGHENRLLAQRLVGAERWETWQQFKLYAKADPSIAVVALQALVRERGLVAQACERGLMEG